MKRKLILILAFLVALASTEAAYAGKKKPFYDVKSQLLGISGDVDSLAARGFVTKIFVNEKINGDQTLPNIDENRKKKGWTDEQIAAMVEQMNNQRLGHKVLEVLFPYKRDSLGTPIGLSDEEMNKRAMYNVQFTDIEKAQIGFLDTKNILQEDWMPLLKNNYIYFEKHQFESFANYIIFYVDITDEIKDQIFAIWNQSSDQLVEQFEAINPEIKFLYQGHEKFKNPQKFQRQLSENIPAFAIRGQLTGRNPATAHIGSNSGLKKGDAVTIYRQSMNADGEMVSNRISRARVNYVEEDNCQMTFISGTRGSYKDGDMVVLTPDKKSGIGIYANYSLGHFFGASLIYDQITNVSKAGFSGRFLVQLKVDYADYDRELWKALGDYGYNPPIIGDLSFGYGLAWTLLGRIELMPYATVGAEYVRAFSKTENNKSNVDLHALGIRGAGGLRFDLNIAYPVKLSIGAEYGHVFGLDLSKENNTSKDGAVWVDYREFKDAFKENDLGPKNKHSLNRNGINFFAGLRWVF